MDTQTYATHRHNPRLTGIGLLLVAIALVAFVLRWLGVGADAMFAVGLGAMIAVDFVLLTISRSYTTRLQDRIIRLEMKVRGAQLLSPSQQAALARLPTSQIVALRFASDEELSTLIDRAEREHLTADQIKRAIKTWMPDLHRT
jgi:Family of unknown function (DUF6526)